jgi:hypothetical protein
MPERLMDCMALVDSNDDFLSPCLAIRDYTKFIVYATPLDYEQHWFWISHIRQWPVVINPSMESEIASLAYVHDSRGLCVRPLI